MDIDTIESEAIKSYFKTQGPLYPVLEGRITIIGEPKQEPSSASYTSINSICILFAVIVFVYNRFN